MNTKAKCPHPDTCVTRHVYNKLYECLTESPYLCSHAFMFGNRYFCNNPVNKVAPVEQKSTSDNSPAT